jgi:hypothetical protein
VSERCVCGNAAAGVLGYSHSSKSMMPVLVCWHSRHSALSVAGRAAALAQAVEIHLGPVAVCGCPCADCRCSSAPNAGMACSPLYAAELLLGLGLFADASDGVLSLQHC